MYNYINDIEIEAADIYTLSCDENQFKIQKIKKETERTNEKWEQRLQIAAAAAAVAATFKKNDILISVFCF